MGFADPQRRRVHTNLALFFPNSADSSTRTTKRDLTVIFDLDFIYISAQSLTYRRGGRSTQPIFRTKRTYLLAVDLPGDLRTHQRTGLSLRPSFTILVNLRANSKIRCSCLRCTSSFGINSPPIPSAAAPAKTKFKAVCWFTPPEAINGTFDSGAFSAQI